jgi:hypothetical protein
MGNEEKKQMLIKDLEDHQTQDAYSPNIKDKHYFEAVLNSINQLNVKMDTNRVEILTENQAKAIWNSFLEVDHICFKISLKPLRGFKCFMITTFNGFHVDLYLQNHEGKRANIRVEGDRKRRSGK